MRISKLHNSEQNTPVIGYDYNNQAWVVDGRYKCCGHPDSMNCRCYGRIHAGEPVAADADVG